MGNVGGWYPQSWGLEGAPSSLASRVRGPGDHSHGCGSSHQLLAQAELFQKPGNLGTQTQMDKGMRGSGEKMETLLSFC